MAYYQQYNHIFFIIFIKIHTSSRTAVKTIAPGVVHHITIIVNFCGTPVIATILMTIIMPRMMNMIVIKYGYIDIGIDIDNNDVVVHHITIIVNFGGTPVTINIIMVTILMTIIK